MNRLYSTMQLVRPLHSNSLFSVRALHKISSPILYQKSSTDASEAQFSPSLSTNYEMKNQSLNLPMVTKQSIFQKLKESIGLQGSLKYPQPVLTYASYRLYMSIQYQVEYDKFFKLCESPDTMYSFCLVNFLHIWLVSIPLMHFGQTGLYVRKALYRNMWKDIETRDRKLKKPMKKEDKVKTYSHLNDIFRGFLVGFDEGLLSDDTVLAGAVWRHLFEQAPIKDYASLAKLVDYIRKNAQHLDGINEIDYLKHGIVTFIGLDEKEIDHLKARQNLIELIRRKEREA